MVAVVVVVVVVVVVAVVAASPRWLRLPGLLVWTRTCL